MYRYAKYRPVYEITSIILLGVVILVGALFFSPPETANHTTPVYEQDVPAHTQQNNSLTDTSYTKNESFLS